MFSGIVEALGTIVELRDEPPGCRLIVREPKIAAETRVADSISVNGCCLTVINCQGRRSPSKPVLRPSPEPISAN